MRIAVTHFTQYRYGGLVFPQPHTVRLRPREDGAQHVLRYALEISPEPAGRSACLDQDGNVVVEAWFDHPIAELAVTSSFEIETLRENPFDFHLASPELGQLPLAYADPLRSAVAPYVGSSAPAPAVWDLASSVLRATDGQTLPFLSALNQRLFEALRHTIRDEGPPLAPEATLEQGEGSCRDLALLFCAVCRGMGIPARFVSGYEREAATHEKAHMHAWAEVYLAGGGWRGYDPSQGLAVYSAHVAVAAAADPLLAAPISGSFRGSARAEMAFTIEMQVGS
jgi:transglutaminase-like putative cysteine protease